jgi:hypothetical protein
MELIGFRSTLKISLEQQRGRHARPGNENIHRKNKGNDVNREEFSGELPDGEIFDTLWKATNVRSRQ